MTPPINRRTIGWLGAGLIVSSIVAGGFIHSGPSEGVLFVMMAVGAFLFCLHIVTAPSAASTRHNEMHAINDNIREQLAELVHVQWAAWALNLSESETISPARLERWARLIATPYSALTDDEKEQDREWADKILAIVNGEDV